MTTNELDLEMPEENTSEESSTEETSSGSTTGGAWSTSGNDPLSEELAIAKEALARAQADYKNLLTRTERERREMATFMTEKILTKILPSLDSLERIVAFTPESERTGSVYKGVAQSATGLSKALESLGLTPFVSVGEMVDPSLHEAIMQAPGEEGKIVTEIEKGYKLSDKVIRHAKVVVGNGEVVSEQ